MTLFIFVIERLLKFVYPKVYSVQNIDIDYRVNHRYFCKMFIINSTIS